MLIGWAKEVSGVNCQESTRETLLQTLKITLQEASEATFTLNEQDEAALLEAISEVDPGDLLDVGDVLKLIG